MPIGASSTTLPVRPRELALVVALQRRTGPLLARWMVGADRWGRGWLWAAVASTLGAAGGRPGRQAAAEMLQLTTISLPSYHLVKRLARRPRPAAASPLVASLALQLDRLRPSIVHVHTPFAAHLLARRWARRLGTPLVLTFHTDLEDYVEHYLPILPPSLCRLVARALTRCQCAQADLVVTPTEAVAALLRRYGVAKPIEVIPTGIPIRELSSADGAGFRLRRGIDPNGPLLGCVGRLAQEKNLEFLLRMFVEVRKALPRARLLFAGEGPAMGRLLETSRRLGLASSVLFAGNLARRNELWSCYAALDLFVLASRTETQGLVLLEAMASGVPIVSTASLGTVEVRADGSGAVVVPEEEGRFAAAVVELLTAPERARQAARLGREWVWNRWSASARAEQLADAYRSLLRNGSTSARIPRPRRLTG